jgi:hypothetical protein
VSEWLKRLTFGSAAWNAWRREHPDLVIALDHADLNGMILTGIDLPGPVCEAPRCTRPIS